MIARAGAMDPIEEEVLTAQEAADFLKITRARLYRLPIPCSVLGARTRRYLRSDVLAYLKRARMGKL